MGQRYETLSQSDKAFIGRQHLFFIASSSGQEVNLSPRGYDCFRILGDSEALFLDYPGSGNRTARDIAADGEVTLMFCAFEGKPKIVRLFCKGERIDADTVKHRALFDPDDLRGMRRFVKLRIYCVEHSCGMSVPFYDYKGEREELRGWCVKGEREGKVEAYIAEHDVPPDLDEFRTVNFSNSF
jgi:hypothetical protein